MILSIIDNLITDRTQEDVDRWLTLRSKGWGAMTESERTEWLAGMRGAYTPYIDMNRVTAAMEYLNNELNGYGYSTGYVDYGIVWTKDDNPTKTQLEQYLSNISAIKAAFYGLKNAPDVPDSMEKLTVEKANDIERILLAVETAILQTVKGMARSNSFAFWSGNRPFPTADSNKGRPWSEFDAMGLTWSDMEPATWYLIAYGDPRKV